MRTLIFIIIISVVEFVAFDKGEMMISIMDDS